MRNTLVTLLVLAAPRAALACPVCFGQNDSPMARAANISILAMLVVVAGVLVGFATFFIHLVRRARLVAVEALDPAGRLRRSSGRPPQRGCRVGDPGGPPNLHVKAEVGRHVLQGSNPQEGTAQC